MAALGGVWEMGEETVNEERWERKRGDGKKFPEMKIAEKKRGVAARVAGKTAKIYCTLTSTTTTKTTDTKR